MIYSYMSLRDADRYDPNIWLIATCLLEMLTVCLEMLTVCLETLTVSLRDADRVLGDVPTTVAHKNTDITL